jgi:hypothetical protein
MVPEEKEANQMHSLQTGYWFVNLIMNFWTSQYIIIV